VAFRLVAAITHAEEEQEQYLLAAQLSERRVHMLNALKPFVDDPSIETTLRALIGAPKASPVKTAATVAAQPATQTRQSPTPFPVIVTRDIVIGVAKTLSGDGERAFTTTQICEHMIGDKAVNPKDRTRILASISHACTVLGERGQIELLEKGFGKTPALWVMPGTLIKTKPKTGPKAPLEDSKPNAPQIYDQRKVNGVKTLRTIRTQ
jgi:hypothetical protein